MSNFMITAVFNAIVSPAASKLVLLAIADRADKNGACWCGKRDITKRTSLDIRTVDRAVLSLMQKGFLSMDKGTGLHGTNTYRVHPWQGAPSAPRPPASYTSPPGTMPSLPRDPDVLPPAPHPPNHIEPLFNHSINPPLPPASEIPQSESTKQNTKTKHATLKPERKHNIAFDALASVSGIDSAIQLTKSEGGKIAKALKDIASTMPDASPDDSAAEIRRRAGNYKLNMPSGCTLTATALASNWQACATAKPRATSDRNGNATSWQAVKNVEEALKVHPGNRDWIGYRRETCSDQNRSDFKELSRKLEDLRKANV